MRRQTPHRPAFALFRSGGGLWCALVLILLLAVLPGCAAKDSASQALTADMAPPPSATTLPYSTVFAIPKDAPPLLRQRLEGDSLLLKLAKSPPDDRQGLDFRIDKDVAEAQRVLRALGYYEGTVAVDVTAEGALPVTAAPTAQQAAALPVSAAPPGAVAGAAFSAPAHTALSTAGVAAGVAADGARASEVQPAVRVTLALSLGPRYSVGESALYYKDGETVLPAPPAEAPARLAEAGLAEAGLVDSGTAKALSPAVAEDILRAVDNIPVLLARRGYPLAKVLEARHVADRETRRIHTAVTVDAGPRVRMGRVRMEGDSAVSPDYVQGLQNWDNSATKLGDGTLAGPWWNADVVQRYRDSVQRLGLFRSVDVRPVPAVAKPVVPVAATESPSVVTAAPATAASAVAATVTEPFALPLSDAGLPAVHGGAVAAGQAPSPTPVYDVLLSVADAPQRTVGGGVNYESDRGLGLQGYWEHRNFFGAGELFRAETSLWQDTQYARAHMRKPAFLDKKQDFTADAWLRNEDSLAYKQRAAQLSVGIERRLWGALSAAVGFSAEGGDVQDVRNARKPYTMTSLPLSVRYGSKETLLDQVQGWRGSVSVSPTWGWYGSSFTAVPTRVQLSAYWPLGLMDLNEANAADSIYRVVLAGRAAAGSLWREDSQTIPAAARFYAGGGGSVRGYAYQSLGPRHSNGDPLGGASYAEFSLEARVRLTRDLALVPFLDAGNVYERSMPDLFSGDGLRYGAGLGLRYHTLIGPLRLDVATPLNPRSGDGALAFYISIGQSF